MIYFSLLYWRKLWNIHKNIGEIYKFILKTYCLTFKILSLWEALETLGDDISITVTLSTTTKDIEIENKDSAPTTPCDNQVLLET